MWSWTAGWVMLGIAIPVIGWADSPSSMSPLYQKPFLIKGRASLGGYMDLEFHAGEEGSTFDQHRFVPFIYAEVSDRVHVASEIEYEHGGEVAGDEETDGEISIEFATVDFKAADALNFRGGVILSPLGRLNVRHDSPALDLTERPLVDQEVIPTTLSEAGLGLYGSFAMTEMILIDYEGYLVNGFKDAVVEGGVLDPHEGKGSKSDDNNNSRAFVGRLGLSPRLGTEIGVSVHTGDYDSSGTQNLTIAALDARFAAGPFEFLGEGAMGRGDYEETPGVEETAESAGFYLEGHYHLLSGAISALPQSVFTLATRLDYVDHDQNVDGLDEGRLTLGLNFRVTEETVFKNDVLFDRIRPVGVSDWDDTQTSYRFSVATYF
jgi:hypothetical protein